MGESVFEDIIAVGLPALGTTIGIVSQLMDRIPFLLFTLFLAEIYEVAGWLVCL